MRPWHRLFLALAALHGSTSVHGKDIILHLTPSEDAAIIAQLTSTAPLVQTARPVLDTEKAQQGWKWLEYTTTLDGYILTEQLSKNFEVAPDSLVRVEPTNQAHVLTLIQPSDQFEITASNDRWSTIRFRKAVPVYFRQHAVPTYTADQVPGHALPQPLQIDPNAKTANISPSALKPENVKWRAAPAGTPDPVLPKKTSSTARAKPSSIMTGSTDLQGSELPQSPEVQADSPLRNLTGTLVREISNTGPRYPIRLKSSEGQRIAFVDMSHVFISDLRPFLKQTVQVIGEVRPLVPGGEELIIQARTIRITK